MSLIFKTLEEGKSKELGRIKSKAVRSYFKPKLITI